LHPSHQTPFTEAEAMQTPATPEERIAAIEELLGRLMEVLEGEEKFSMDALTRWIATCRAAERRHQIADARAQVVFAQLCERLQLTDPESSPEANPQAQQDAAAALKKFHQPPSA
jgi:hypothetical protein